MIEAGSTALVTGASSGIGEQFARKLADRSVNLVLVARNEGRLHEVAAEIKKTSPSVVTTVVVADLSVPKGPTGIAGQLGERGVSVDLLVNNAGVGSLGAFVDGDLSAITREIQLNCASLVDLTARFLPGMLERRRGGVINVASTAAFQPVPTMAVYAASKAFVLSFTEALWAETRTSGVRVLALCPGPTETPFFATASADKQFMVRGRQTPEQVVDAAFAAFESGHGPSVVPGTRNRLLATGYRLFPRSVMARMAQRNVRPD